MPAKQSTMPDGFGRLLSASLIVHIIALIIVAVFFKDDAGRRIIPVNYTLVKLVGPTVNDRQTGTISAPAPPAGHIVPEKIDSPAIKSPDVTSPSKQTADAPKPEQTARTEKPSKSAKRDTASVSEAIKKLALKAKKKQARSSIESRLEAIRRSRSALAASSVSGKPNKSGASAGSAGTRAARGAADNRTASRGVDKSGISAEAELKGRYSAYYSILRNKIQNKWIYPEGLTDSNMLVSARVRIGRNGALLEAKLSESSGNPLFDDSLINAIKKAAPFPPLPEDYEYNSLEAVIRFCSSCGD